MGKQYNLQIQVRDETRELFKQTFQGSGQDSQGSFLRELLDVYLSEDNVKIVDNPDLAVRIDLLQSNLDVFQTNPVLTGLFSKYEGKTVKFEDAKNKTREITIKSLVDVFNVIMYRVKE